MNEASSAGGRGGGHSAANSSPEVDAREARLRDAVEAVRRGEQHRFDEIVAELGSQVHATAWRMTQNADDAMDVAQEAFVRMYHALGAWRGNSRFSTWAHRIVLNTAVDYLRRQARHYRGRVELPQGADNEDPFEPPEWAGITEPMAAKSFENEELRGAILKAVDRLSGNQKRCFLLRYYQDLGIHEIAETLGTSDGTVKRHLFRATRKLRELLKDRFPK